MNDKRGFTLIEMVGVLVLFSLLASILIMQYTTTLRKSRIRLNEEQKSRLVEVAKDISLNNKNCLELAQSNLEVGAKITIEQMQKSGYIANNQLKDIEENTILNSCVIIKWNAGYQKFEYFYNENCLEAKLCSITSETEKVIISSFSVGENNTNYSSSQTTTYRLKYNSSINSEYCVTLGSEVTCNWQKLSMSSTSLEGTITLTNIENIVHLYIRNSNKNIITSLDTAVFYDNVAPTCTWTNPTRTYINNGSTAEITLNCSDVAGIKNTELLASAITISDDALLSISDAVITMSGTNKSFKFTVYGHEGDGAVNLTLKPNVIADSSGNYLKMEVTSQNIHLDNHAPDGTIKVGEDGSGYTNKEAVVLKFSNVSSDIDKICVSNSSSGNCNYVRYASSYNWTLTSGEGSKNIYVNLMDKAGNITNKIITVYLDKIKPNCIITTPKAAYYLKNGSYVDYTINCTDNNQMGNNTITLEDISIDNKANNQVDVSVVSSNSTSTTIRVSALTGDGQTIVYLNAQAVKDAAGNYNDKTQITKLNIDNTPPFNNQIKINYGATITNVRTLNLILTSDIITEGGYYCVKSTSTSCSDSEWFSYTGETATYTIASENGTYTIYAFFKDAAGNISLNPVIASIKYNVSAISCSINPDGENYQINTLSTSLAANPYSADGITWTSNNKLLKETGKIRYFSYIKDINGDTNYCELIVQN